MPRYAKVRFPSALPQLDKEFDYQIPDGLDLEFGQLVSVPFGSNKANKVGVVVEITDASEFASKVSAISSIEFSKSLLTKQQLDLAKAVAARQAGSVGELLSQVLPKRFKRTETNYVSSDLNYVQMSEQPKTIDLSSKARVFSTFDYFVSASGYPSWVNEFMTLAQSSLALGKSTLVVLPDYRAVEAFEQALVKEKLQSFGIKHESSDAGSLRYTNYLRCLDEVAIIYGVRSTVFMPAQNLGLILLLDDADESHIEQSAPYWSSRDVLLQRAELENVPIVISSQSPSAEVVRLIDLEYFERYDHPVGKPLVRVTDNHTRLDDESFAYISNCLRSAKPVLIQTANLGKASGVACRKCRELRVCPSCAGRIWLDATGQFRCRSCKFVGQLGPCSCGGVETSMIKLGSSGLAESLEKAFPEATVVHSSGAERITSVDNGATLVIATPGAEPFVEGGYACVLLADAYSMVAGSRLRSMEQAALRWANAVSLASREGLVIFVGLTGDVAEQAKQLDFYSMISSDYQDRVELGLPPAVRLLSVTSTSVVDLGELLKEVQDSDLANRLRRLPSEPNQLVFTYSYSDGTSVASGLSDLANKVSYRSKFRKPGQRLFRICMDDANVL